MLPISITVNRVTTSDQDLVAAGIARATSAGSLYDSTGRQPAHRGAHRSKEQTPSGVKLAEGAEIEPGSAQWHKKLIHDALQREEAKPSQGSPRSALRTTRNPRGGLHSRDGRHTGLPGARALLGGDSAPGGERPLISELANEKRPHTSRDKTQAHDQHSPTQRWPGSAGLPWGRPAGNAHRPSTSGTPREARINRGRPATQEHAVRPHNNRTLSTTPKGRETDQVRSSSKQIADPLNCPASMPVMQTVRPMTQEHRREMTSKSLTSFYEYFDKMPLTRIPNTPGPSALQSSSVEAFIDVDADHLSEEELLETLAHREHRVQTKVPQIEQFKAALRADQLDVHRQRPSPERIAGPSWSKMQGRQASPGRLGLTQSHSGTNFSQPAPSDRRVGGQVGSGLEAEFKSTGLHVHAEIERLRTVDESRKNSKPDEERIAQCCSLLERMQVKYFDEEMASLKEEMFRAIFLDYDVLKRKPAPRSSHAFLGAKPYFEQLKAEKDKSQELAQSIRSFQAQAEMYKDQNQRLEDRVRMLTEMRGGVDSGIGGAGVHTSKMREAGNHAQAGSGMMISAAQLSLGGQGVVDVGMQGRHDGVRLSAQERLQRQISVFENGTLQKKDNVFFFAQPGISLVASEIEDLEKYLRMYKSALAGQSAADFERQEQEHAEQAQREAQQRDALKRASVKGNEGGNSSGEETWEEKGGEDRKGRGEGIDKKRVPPGYNLVMGSRLKRQKAPREARWRDFAMYLERLSRRETLPVKREKLRDLYDKWRFPFEYKATFATMLRALERHKQISIEGAGNDVICYSDHMAKGLLLSSDEEEDLDSTIEERDKAIARLQIAKQALEEKLEWEQKTSANRLDTRMNELEKISDKIFETAQNRQDEKIKILSDKVQQLKQDFKDKEDELQKVQYLLQDGDSLAATAKRYKEEKEALELRSQRREAQLQEQTKMDQELIAQLQKRLEVADVIQKTGREQLKIKVGFATQRELAKEQKTHQQRLDDIQRLFEEKLELAELKGNVAQLQVSMSERRFNVVMSILNGLGDSMEALIAGTDNPVLIKQAQAEFAAARERFLQQAEVEDLDESEEEEEASDGGRVRVRTSEAQTNLTPAALGLEDPAAGVKIKKGKRKEKKGRKEKVAQAEPLAPIDPERVRVVQCLIDMVFQQLEPTDATSLGAPVVPVSASVTEIIKSFVADAPAVEPSATPERMMSHDLQQRQKQRVKSTKEGSSALQEGGQTMIDGTFVHRCLVRYLLVKCGHKDVALRELEELGQTLIRLREVDQRCAVFARICNFFSPLPRDVTELLLRLKANCWHVTHPDLEWAESARQKGLASGRPEARDGVVEYSRALEYTRKSCVRLELRFDWALEKLDARIMFDKRRKCQVLAVETVIIVVTGQIDLKMQHLSRIFVREFPPPPADGELAVSATLGHVLTIDKMQDLLQEGSPGNEVTYQQALEVMVDLAKHCGPRRATGEDFARTCLERMPEIVSATGTKSQWDAQADCGQAKGEGVYVRDSTFLTTG